MLLRILTFVSFSPDPPSQTQELCSTLPLLPKETGVLPLHSHPHTGTEHFPAAPAPLHMTLQMCRKGLKWNYKQSQAPCCLCWDLNKLPGQEVGRGVGRVEESLSWGMGVPLEQRVLEEVLKKTGSFWNMNHHNSCWALIHIEVTYFQREQRHRTALWDSCHTAAYHYTLWIYRSVTQQINTHFTTVNYTTFTSVSAGSDKPLGGTVALSWCGNTDNPLLPHIYWDPPIPHSVSQLDMVTLCGNRKWQNKTLLCYVLKWGKSSKWCFTCNKAPVFVFVWAAPPVFAVMVVWTSVTLTT